MAFAFFKGNRAGYAELLNSDTAREACAAPAERVLAAAQSSAPVATGTYRDSLRIEAATTDRAVTRVVASARHSLAVEAKTGNLTRALDSA